MGALVEAWTAGTLVRALVEAWTAGTLVGVLATSTLTAGALAGAELEKITELDLNKTYQSFIGTNFWCQKKDVPTRARKRRANACQKKTCQRVPEKKKNLINTVL